MSKEDLKVEIMGLVRIASSYAWLGGEAGAVGDEESRSLYLTREQRTYKVIEKKLEELDELD